MSKGRATVKFFDQREVSDVDATVLADLKSGAYVEVYGNLALSVLTPAMARKREAAWKEVRRAALMPPVGREKK